MYPENVILDTPNGRWSLVGRVDERLCRMVPADRSAIMGGRWVRDESGAAVEPRPLCFNTLAELETEAAHRGFRRIMDGSGPHGRFTPVD